MVAAIMLVLGCASCAGIPQGARWTPLSPPLSDLDGEWDRTHEVIAEGVRIKAMNSGQDLHLRFETDDPVLQDEFSGQYGQSLLLWIASGPGGHGLRIDFKPKGGASVSVDPVSNMDRSVTLLGPPMEGYPRPWTEGTEGLELTSQMDSGTLIYELRLPLEPRSPGSFGLGLKPGDSLRLNIETSKLSADSQDFLVSRGVFGASASIPTSAYGTTLDLQLAMPPHP
jgi:hypothetical protein